MAESRPSVDIDRPLLVQVGAMGDAYDAWVHRSIQPGQSLRIFHSPLLEAMSHVRWWLVPLVWVPVISALLGVATAGRGVPAGRALWLAAIGLFLWTLLEYGLHRFAFHYRVRSSTGRRIHFLAHGIHHLDPWDATRLVFPPFAALAIALPVFLLIYAGVAWTVEPLGNAMAVMGGLIVGYVAYDMIHYATHHVKPRTAMGRYLKRYHLEHHHRHPDRLFGVSSPLWDLVLGTARPRTAEVRPRARSR